MTDLRGQIGLRQHATDWIGRAIEWDTESITHHVVVHIGNGLCVSAERPRVIVRHISDYPGLVNSEFELTEEQRKSIVNAALAFVNPPRPYNTAALVILGLSKLTGLRVPVWVRDWLKRRPNVDCSQLADLALQAGGISLFPHDPALVTPADFQHILEQQSALEPS
jgi:hypothetical protein